MFDLQAAHAQDGAVEVDVLPAGQLRLVVPQAATLLTGSGRFYSSPELWLLRRSVVKTKGAPHWFQIGCEN